MNTNHPQSKQNLPCKMEVIISTFLRCRQYLLCLYLFLFQFMIVFNFFSFDFIAENKMSCKDIRDFKFQKASVNF
jgi:hypothetical protein